MTTITLKKHDQAEKADQRIQEMYKACELSWVELTYEIIKFHDAGHHIALGFDRFDQWMESRFRKSRSTLFASMRIVRELEKGLTHTEIEKITKANCEALLLLPEPKRYSPEIVAQAQELTESQFYSTVQAVGGEYVKRESVHRMVWELDESLYNLVEECLRAVMEREQTKSRRVALEAIFADVQQEIMRQTNAKSA